MFRRTAFASLGAILLLTACQGGGGSASPSATTGSATSGAASGSAGNPNDLLAKIKQAGAIRVSTDPNYAPQSFQKPDGTFEGFDIDVANEIAKRLGVTVKFITPDFSAVQSGGWAGRWDMSVGSMTITEPRKKVLDFTEPYYFTPAQMSASKKSGITTLDGLAGKKICVGEQTTYQFWLEGTLKLGDGSSTAPVPQGAKATTLKTDQDCAQSLKSGRSDFEGWLSSSSTVDDAIKAGTPVVKVGTPVFYEPLGVAFDNKGAPPHSELLAAVKKIIQDMHADGTLTTLSKKWFNGADLTTKS